MERLMSRLLCLINQHEHVYRERRNGIQHYVCERCGYAVPVVWRTEDGHHDALERGRVTQPKASVRSNVQPSAAERARAKQVLGI